MIRFDTCPELTLLQACSSLVFSLERQQYIQDLVQKTNLDWRYVLRAAVQHRMVPMLYHGLYESSAHIPADIERYLIQYCQVNTRRNLFFERKCQEILTLFDRAQLPAIAYKGPKLAIYAYGNLALRQFTDLDLLVSPQDFEQAQQLLAKHGFALKLDLGWEIHYGHPDQSVNIDLHRSLVPEFFGRAADFLDPRQGTHLSPEDWLLLLAVQLGKDCCHWKVCLSQLCDITALLQTHPELNFEEVLQRARRMGCVRFLGIALLLVQDFLQIELPISMRTYLLERAYERKLVEWVRRQIVQETDTPRVVPDDAGFWYFLRIYNHRFYWQVRERLRDKLLYSGHWIWKIVRVSFRPNQADRTLITLPRPLNFLYVLIHIGRLIWKYSRR